MFKIFCSKGNVPPSGPSGKGNNPRGDLDKEVVWVRTTYKPGHQKSGEGRKSNVPPSGPSGKGHNPRDDLNKEVVWVRTTYKPGHQKSGKGNY
ncbi:unnamed protein product [Leptidea sinapis]|uniref:Uncharacterized protein n=1 Tax=Leptidea sinapis TaxID=189913 RepID=A0A5E4QDD3_9NEOP|nr:unnamed protein product [Leptidea sinapis]